MGVQIVYRRASGVLCTLRLPGAIFDFLSLEKLFHLLFSSLLLNGSDEIVFLNLR